MSKKMLIDAGHPEETRVVVVDGTKVEDFDFESASRRPIRGNIYLAKVTRVEPSLQAAFVEYGGNRHGFLAFNEIHPDYYQIPYEDRAALAAEEASAADSDSDDEAETVSETPAVETDESGEPIEAAESFGDDSDDDDDDIAEEKAARRSRQLYRKYKIQEVVKRRQILLVQVAKEERGNKGAALTTYLSLAGRYCVLMPNTPRGGGISRKIANVTDRKRLKSVVSELDLPKGIGLIIRTAGASRTKIEIRRDADYLLRLWENIRELTLKSVAPALIYEEGNLVKRAIRDLYDKDIDGVLVEGEAAYKEAKAFMRMLMPSHAKKVQHYNEIVPLFLQHQVETQLEAIYSPIAPLKSGGYIVINPTEALVSIDVNSGRSTRERNIETTAVKTNIEAAHEAARQMRLRDLAGLIVIDFIDMDESKNVRAVEKVMKDALKRDRARLQMGRISQFGLMEISRQRRRTSLIEGSTEPCPHCKGSGYIRSVESSALVALRGLEKEGMRGRAKRVRISLPTSIAIYMLNEKRDHLLAIEERFQMNISVASDDEVIAPEFVIEAIELRAPGEEFVIPRQAVVADAEDLADQLVMDEEEDEAESVESESQERGRSRSRGKRDAAPAEGTEAGDGETAEDGTRRRRRRRRRKGSSDDGSAEAGTSAETAENTADEDGAEAGDAETDEQAPGTPAAEDGDVPRRRRRRGRRGGRSRRRTEGQGSEGQGSDDQASENQAEATPADETTAAAPVTAGADAATPASEAADTASAEKPVRKRAPRRRKTADAETAPAESDAPEAAASEAVAAPADEAAATDEAPKRRTRRPRKTAETVASEADAAPAEAEKPKPKPRTRRKKAEVEAEAAVVTSETEAAPAATEKPAPKRKRATTAKPAAKAAAKPAPAAEPEAQAPVETAEAQPAKPVKRGWWNRTGLFGK
ncbi:ribonuclease E/G [Maricaulis salignorans]|uniref:Ribonuclease E n=1 Tax=Maricaulis salignorans TaxID=144026 RepID=A0A1G9UHH2_9PROT|nr:ribonuclease E/G [Maricaulis salignorans]SDM59370.1 RNAse E [Maricaulis salignorans]